MTGPFDEQDDAATPLSEDEREGLIPTYIALRGELNEAEQGNILEAEAWAFARKRHVLDEVILPGHHFVGGETPKKMVARSKAARKASSLDGASLANHDTQIFSRIPRWNRILNP